MQARLDKVSIGESEQIDERATVDK
jgi:hypothetical protein